MPKSKKKILNYEEVQMERALDEVAQGVAVATAARRNNVPRVTLLYKARGKTPLARKMGPEKAFTMDEEKILIKWIITVGKMGFPVTNEDLLNSVKQLAKDLGKSDRFKDGRPTYGWIQRFRSRHPEISSRTAQNLTSTRAAVTKKNILAWFREVHEYLVTSGLENVLTDPKRVFNGDETAFFLNPKGGKVLTQKGQKSVYQKVNPDEKECLTILITANAEGMVVPPMVIFKYDRLPREIADSIPSEFGVGRSENGWMTSATFYEYITNIFFKWLIQENIERPVILFIDGHSSHITYHTSKFCEENGIVLVALYPNATHLMQPMDVAVFRTLKEGWKQAVHEWRCQNLDNPYLKKKHFCPLLKEVLKKRVTKEVVSNGFRKTGLVPWNPDAIEFPFNNMTANNRTTVECTEVTEKREVSEIKHGFNFLCDNLEAKQLQEFQVCKGEWKGNPEDRSLYELYRKIKNRILQVEITAESTDNGRDEGEGTQKNAKRYILEGEREKKIEEKENLVMNEQVTPINIPDNKDTTSEQKYENSKVENVKRKLVIEGAIIPTPFKNNLRWPQLKEVATKKRKRENIPFVATSQQWKSYYEKKEQAKLEQEKCKRERAKEREKKKQEKERLKQLKQEEKKKKAGLVKKKKNIYLEDSSDTEEEEEWVESGSSGDDVSEFGDLTCYENTGSRKDHSTGSSEEIYSDSYGKGDYVLVEFPGKKKTYNYICLILQNYNDKEFEVMALRSCNELKTVFKLDEQDVSTIDQGQILRRLPQPSISGSGDRVKYEFENVEVSG